MKKTQTILTVFATVITIIILTSCSLTGQDDDPFAASAITDPAFKSLTYSIQSFLWWDGGQVGFYLDWIHMMGFTHVKQSFSWRNIEPERDVWFFGESDRILNELERRDLKLVARLSEAPEWAIGGTLTVIDAPPADLNDWANYCSAVAGRYAGRIDAYQIWNEPNLSREWGGKPPDAVGYVELLKVCSEAIRAADPNAKIISAGLAPTGNYDDLAHRDDIYLQAMYDANFQQYVDAVGVHAPGFDAPEVGPDDAEAKGHQRWMSFRRVEDLRKIMIQNGDAARQMAILEVGYTTDPNNPDYSWFAVDQETQAKFLRGAYEYAAEHWRPWVGLMSSIYLADPAWTEANEEYWWSISEPRDGHIAFRPAFDALLRMPKYCDDVVIPERTGTEVIPLESRNPCN